MNTIQHQGVSNLPTNTKSTKSNSIGLAERYRNYAKSQENLKVYWYMKAVIAIPCCFMVPSIIAMNQSTSHLEWYIGFTMLLFFTNLIVHISEQKTIVTLAVYHLTITALILIPVMTYLLNK